LLRLLLPPVPSGRDTLNVEGCAVGCPGNFPRALEDDTHAIVERRCRPVRLDLPGLAPSNPVG